MAEHAELLENAFANYLTAFTINNVSPWSAGLLIFPGENNLDKTGARIVAYVPEDGIGNEDPPLSGNRVCDVVIELRTPFSKLTAKDIANGVQEPLVTHQANADALQSALLSKTIGEDVAASIDGLSIFGIIDRQQMRNQKTDYWGSGWTFKLLSCPASFSN